MNSERSCPRCAQPLVLARTEAVELDVCPGCRGAFLDPGELDKLLDAPASAWIDGGVGVPLGLSELRCPAHVERPQMNVVRLEEAQEIDIDVCPACGGVWVDPDEAEAIDAARLGLERAWAFATRSDELSDEELDDFRFAFRHLGDPLTASLHKQGIRRRRPWVVGITVMLCFISALLTDVESPYLRLVALVPAELAARPWTLFTYVFPHSNLLHWMVNAVHLSAFGLVIELYLGRVRVIVIMVGAALAGGATQVWLDPSSVIPVVGVSAVVTGLYGAFLALLPQVRIGAAKRRLIVIGVVLTLIVVAQEIVIGLAEAVLHIASAAHLGGFFAGGVLGWLLGHGQRKRRALIPKVSKRASRR